MAQMRVPNTAFAFKRNKLLLKKKIKNKLQINLNKLDLLDILLPKSVSLYKCTS